MVHNKFLEETIASALRNEETNEWYNQRMTVDEAFRLDKYRLRRYIDNYELHGYLPQRLYSEA